MQTNVLNLRGEVLRTLDLDDRVFGIEPNEAVVYQAVVTQQANARQGTHDTKTRGEVAGGGRKPYKQKGTGNARQGSTRAPHYRHGGIVFGPHPRSYEKAMPRKMRRLAMRSVLSARLAENAVTIVDSFELSEAKSRAMLSTLAALGAGEGALVVIGERSESALRAARNLERVHLVTPNGLNLLDLMRTPRVVMEESAVELLTRTLTSDLATPLDLLQIEDSQPAAPKSAPAVQSPTASAVKSPAETPVPPSAEEAAAPAEPGSTTIAETEAGA